MTRIPRIEPNDLQQRRLNYLTTQYAHLIAGIRLNIFVQKAVAVVLDVISCQQYNHVRLLLAMRSNAQPTEQMHCDHCCACFSQRMTHSAVEIFKWLWMPECISVDEYIILTRTVCGSAGVGYTGNYTPPRWQCTQIEIVSRAPQGSLHPDNKYKPTCCNNRKSCQHHHKAPIRSRAENMSCIVDSLQVQWCHQVIGKDITIWRKAKHVKNGHLMYQSMYLEMQVYVRDAST